MRTIDLSTAFKKDYKRAKANPRHAQDVRALYEAIALLLAEDKPLPERYRDHALVGEWERLQGMPPKAGFALDLQCRRAGNA